MTTASGEPAGADRPRVDLRLDRPTPARMYDYFLGGKDNFQVDRDAAHQLDAVSGKGLTSTAAWENRRFLQRAVAAVAEAGIDQFIDVGAGLPTQENTHQIAQRTNPNARVVYVDNDPIVLAHGRALLADNEATTVITADMREPDAILDNADLRALIDLTRPLAVLFVSVLHFIHEDENPYGLVGAFKDVMAAGSYLTLSQIANDGIPSEDLDNAETVYKRATSPVVPRTRAQISSFFDGLDLLEPGLVRPWQWRPNEKHGPATELQYGGVAKKTG